ncbi:hypothetical protein AB9F26_19590 [Falsihalocynthiibacter sp. BN13B15]|uniref:hypothetical protein n=1 Tax=Falsihalocynthiibacter sp. BN13B15 TaxID=3240871 RepID=UPI0035101626
MVIDDLVTMPPRPQSPMNVAPFHSWTAPDGVVWTNFFRDQGGFLLRFPGLADFQVASDGSKALCWLVPGNDASTQEHLFLNQVLPLMQSARGELYFHASAVECDGDAIAFFGTSGRGKSTLAASFAISGNRFLTDDGFMLARAPDGFTVLPSHPSVRMWDDTKAALGADLLAMAPPVPFTDKARVLAGERLPHCADPRSLVAAFFLGSGDTDEISFRRMRGTDALTNWMSNIFLLDVQDKNRIRHNFEAVAEISETVPSIALDYPRRYSELGDLRAAILSATRDLRGVK